MRNNLFVLLIKLTENDKRVIFVLLAAIIVILVLIAFIGHLVHKLLIWQGKKINNYVKDVVITGVITDEKEFKKYAKKKNWRVFYDQAKIPALIVVIGSLFFVIASAIQGHYDNPFDYHTGIGTVLFVWDFSTIITKPETGIGILINYPALINTPHLTTDAWVSYVFIPTVFVGGFWYLYCVQGFLGRYIQIHKLSQKIFNESLEVYLNNRQFPNGEQQVVPPQNTPLPFEEKEEDKK